MGANMKALRSRIKSVESTQHLVKAMGLVASSKIRRASDAMVHSRQYREAVQSITELLGDSPECRRSVYMRQPKQDDTVKLVVIAGDRGLAGGYNSNVFRLTDSLSASSVIPIGRRAADRYGDRTSLSFSAEYMTRQECAVLAGQLCKEFLQGEYGRLGIVCTKYVSMLTQEANILWVLPLAPNETQKKEQSAVLFEPDAASVLDTAVYEYVCGMLYAAVRESFACEVAARRNAMDAAGKNAKKMTDDLTLQYNRARQSAITQEITEIVAGSGT